MDTLKLVLNNCDSGIYYAADGETLKDVAIKFNTCEKLIVLDNNLTSDDICGMPLFIKKYKTIVTVNVGETIENLCEKFAVSPETLLKINGIEYIYPGQRIIIKDE